MIPVSLKYKYVSQLQCASSWVNKNFHIKSKIWIEDADGNVVFGLGRFRILDAIERLGSLQAAAKELKMSYRAVWCRVRVPEDRIGKPLVAREGRGSRLTVHAERLMKQFKRLQAIVENESDDVYNDLMSNQLEK
jgi:molybdate transport system regulatory protein